MKKANTPSSTNDKNKDVAKQEGVRLNKFIANAGICSRREADKLIAGGKVSINGNVITEMGYKVVYSDNVEYLNKPLKREKMVYLLLNKPKDFITTVKDPQGRKTVMDLVGKASDYRIYPVGRLDRYTTGVLLFTNDGKLAEKLTHPSFEHKKIYHVTLNNAFKTSDLDVMRKGFDLEDGFIKADNVSFVSTGKSKKEVGIEIHSGRNRIVRRMFEHLGYEVIKLDRVYFASLTKKDLPRGKWRWLDDKEVAMLKVMK